MTKATVITDHGEGEYTVQLELNLVRAQQLSSDLAQRVIDITQVVLDAQVATLDAETAYKDKLSEVDAAIVAEESEETINALLREAYTLKAAYESAKIKEKQLVAQKLSLSRAKTTIDNHIAAATQPQIRIWCADYTEGLSGTISVILNPAENTGADLVIRPGYTDNAAWSQAIHGWLTPPWSQTAAQVYYNYAMLPGVQKWIPTYRYGTITAISGTTCDVSLEAVTSSAQSLDVNVQATLSNVACSYMDCNIAAFEVGDRVVVRFDSTDKTTPTQNWDNPVVIGFVTNPKPCRIAYFLWEPEGIFITPKRTSDAPNGWGPPRTNWSNLALINPPYGTPSPSGDIQSEPVLINRFQYNKYPDGGANYVQAGLWELPDGTRVTEIEKAAVKYERYEKPGLYTVAREHWAKQERSYYEAQPVESETGTWYAHWPEDITYRNDVDKAIFQYSNAYRDAVGEKPVNPTPRGLADVAYFSVYQAHKHESMAHSDWIRYDDGYQFVGERGYKEGIISWGENLALVPDSSVTVQAGETFDYALGRTIVEAWVASPAHYSTMISSDWTTYPEGAYTGFAYLDIDHRKNTTISWRQEPPYAYPTDPPLAVSPPEVGNYAAQIFRLIPATLTAYDSVWEGVAGRVSWNAPASRYFKASAGNWRTNASLNPEIVSYQGRNLATRSSRSVLGACVFTQNDVVDVNGTPTAVETRYIRTALITDSPYTLEIRRSRIDDMILDGYSLNAPDSIYVLEATFDLSALDIIQVSKVLFNSTGDEAIFHIVRRLADNHDGALSSTETNWNNTTTSTHNRGVHNLEHYHYVDSTGLFTALSTSAITGNATASTTGSLNSYDLTIAGTTPFLYDFSLANDSIISASITVNDSVSIVQDGGVATTHTATLSRTLTFPSSKQIQYLTQTVNSFVGSGRLETFHYLDIRNDDYVSSRTDFTISEPVAGTFQTDGDRELYFNDSIIWQGPATTWDSIPYTVNSNKAAYIPVARLIPSYYASGATETHHAVFGSDTDLQEIFSGATRIDIVSEPIIGPFEASTATKGVEARPLIDDGGTAKIDAYAIAPSFDFDFGLGIFSSAFDTRVGVGFSKYKTQYVVNVAQTRYFGTNDVSANPVSMQDDAFFVSHSTLNLETLTTVTPLRKNLFPVGVV